MERTEIEQERIDLQVDIADLLNKRYGSQATGGNLKDDGGIDFTFGWNEARKFLADLQRIDSEDV